MGILDCWHRNDNEIIKMELKKMKENKNKSVNAFGLDAETVEKSLNILPVLDLGALADGGTVKVEFLENEPIEVQTPNSKFADSARVIKVREISLAEAEMDFSLFLSSKSLALGINRLYVQNGNKLQGIKAVIKKGKATYKDFGENTCYMVQQLRD